MVINTNLSAQNAATLLMQSQSNLSASLQRLSSGSKITSPADDSAGLAVSMKLNAQMSRIDAASNNVNNAISFSQTQDGYVQQVNSAFSRMSELSVLAQDVTKTTGDRALYQQEFHALGNYINNVSTKDFNGVSLFDGTTLNVTTDSEANTFGMQGINLAGNTTYTTADGGRHHVHQRGEAGVDGREGRHLATGFGPREHWFQRRKPVVLQQPALDVEEQPLGGQQPDHGCGCGDRKHATTPRKTSWCRRARRCWRRPTRCRSQCSSSSAKLRFLPLGKARAATRRPGVKNGRTSGEGASPPNTQDSQIWPPAKGRRPVPEKTWHAGRMKPQTPAAGGTTPSDFSRQQVRSAAASSGLRPKGNSRLRPGLHAPP